MVTMEVIRFLVFSFLYIEVTVSWHTPEYKLVDLSYNFDNSTIGWVTIEPYEMNITVEGEATEGYWLQVEEYSSGTHVGTHMDAPCHIAKGRWTIDEIPLEHLVAPAAVIDITSRVEKDVDALVLVKDLQEWEMTTGNTLDGTIVLVRTGFGRRWPDELAYVGNTDKDAYNLHFPGVSEEAASWIVKQRRVYGVGIEALSLDNGPNAGKNLPAHQILLGADLYGIENLANMHMLPISGSIVHALPMKMKGACGAPVRLIAHVPYHKFSPRI